MLSFKMSPVRRLARQPGPLLLGCVLKSRPHSLTAHLQGRDMVLLAHHGQAAIVAVSSAADLHIPWARPGACLGAAWGPRSCSGAARGACTHHCPLAGQLPVGLETARALRESQPEHRRAVSQGFNTRRLSAIPSMVMFVQVDAWAEVDLGSVHRSENG